MKDRKKAHKLSGEREYAKVKEGQLKSGKLVIRMPKSLHTMLAAEAEEEGVSLNQLMLCKLSNRIRWQTLLVAPA